MTTTLRTAIAAALIATCATCAAGAQAATVNGLGGKLTPVKTFFGTTPRTTTVPVWTVTDGDTTALALCVEPLAQMTNRTGLAATAFDGFAGRGDIARLFSSYYGTLSTTENTLAAAGFQLALWELYRDDGVLTTGALSFAASSLAATTPNVVTTAAAMLATANNTALAIDTRYRYTLFSGTNAQPVVTATIAAVPEPSTWAMLGAGLALVGACARRRRSA